VPDRLPRDPVAGGGEDLRRILEGVGVLQAVLEWHPHTLELDVRLPHRAF
jgi:hypothetical protein